VCSKEIPEERGEDSVIERPTREKGREISLQIIIEQNEGV